MSAVLFRQCLGNAAGKSATFSKTGMQDSPFLSAKLGNLLLQKTDFNRIDSVIQSVMAPLRLDIELPHSIR